MRHFKRRLQVGTALLCVAGVVNAAETSLLPIESGNYVVTTYRPCESAPFAGLMTFDGKTFSGPHASDCSSKVLGHQNSTYKISTECRANGDGSPATPKAVIEYLRIESPTHFVKLGEGRHSEYELCPAWR